MYAQETPRSLQQLRGLLAERRFNLAADGRVQTRAVLRGGAEGTHVSAKCRDRFAFISRKERKRTMHEFLRGSIETDRSGIA